MLLLNPKHHANPTLDARSQEVMAKTIGFFEAMGKDRLMDEHYACTWYAEFLEFVARERLFSTISTPAAVGGEGARWDTHRISAFAEILGFYGLPYWYTWQVSVLGLCPIWMSPNEKLKARAKKLLDDGGIFAFGLSEKTHGADIYSSDMIVTKLDDGTYRATGGKYYIGNGNKAALVSVFGKMAETGEYIFFAVDSQHPNYKLDRNVVASQSYVAEFHLESYPFTDDDVLSRGRDAWDAALNTVNICKYNLGWGSVGICTHALYEAITHAANRKLYGMMVTDFPHVKRMFTDAYARLSAMKLFSLRAADYMRAANANDRRYLLFNPMVKMKVTTQGEDVINLLWDVIAAKGFEKDMFFSQAGVDIRGLPKLEGTVHVNVALIVKFMASYFFMAEKMPVVPSMQGAVDDTFLFHQGPTKGLGQIKFHDYALAFEGVNLPNVLLFREQLETFKEMLAAATPSPEQMKDTDFLLAGGEMFAAIVYAQLILENSKLLKIDDDLLDQIFDFMVRDFSALALSFHNKKPSTPEQMDYALKMLKKPIANDARTTHIWNDVHALSGAYEMPR